MKIEDVDVLVACEIENAPVVTLEDNKKTVAICAAASAVTGLHDTMLLGPQLTFETESSVAPVLESVNVPLELVCPLASCCSERIALRIWLSLAEGR